MTEQIVRQLSSPATADTIDELALLDASALDQAAPQFRGAGEAPVSTTALEELLEEMPRPEARAESDRWLAPRIHSVLRLTRRQASVPGIWGFLAGVTARDYVVWRWSNSDKIVAADRWTGPIHKQAIARLWWGAELFRDGADYAPVERFFLNQDLPNSYLHRPFVRLRPIALGVLEALRAAVPEGANPTSDQINDVAKKVNLTIAARSMETATVGFRQDTGKYLEWMNNAPSTYDPTSTPTGPDDGFVPKALLDVGTTLGAEICSMAGVGEP